MSNHSYSVNFHMRSFVQINSFLVRVSFSLQGADGQFSTLLKGSVADMCKYYRNNSTNIFVRLFYNAHFGKKNFPTACPIKPGDYFMNDFKVNDKFLRLRFVDSKFLMQIEMCTKLRSELKRFANLKVYGEISYRQKWEEENTEREVT